ncbi:PAS domain-containing protein, partial [Nodosilinea sp. LEGE 07298]|uniref:PAS domain-containing protein n=1 Tax=Nodosilinea sp. LEGE 07298 TaxID=2777970 RepID=UPI00188082FF
MAQFSSQTQAQIQAQAQAQTQVQRPLEDSPSPGAPLGNPDRLSVLLLDAGGDRLAQSAPPTCCLFEADTLTQALDFWQTGLPDWAVVDLAWAEGSGLAFLAALGDTCAQRPLPVVVLVGPGQERMALEAMKLGAADYCFKAEFTPADLWGRLSQPQRAHPTALEQAHQHYQNLVENSPDIIERFDCKLRHLYISPSLARLIGADTTTFLGKTCRELNLDSAMVNAWEAAAAALLATGDKQTIEFTTPTLIGTRHFEMAIAPEWSATGEEIESILCISRDISDRVVAEQAQAQLLADAQRAQVDASTSRNRLANVFERINDGIVALDLDGRFTYINHQAAQIIGHDPSELLGQQVWHAFPEVVGQPFYDAFHRAIAQQQPVNEELFYPPFDRWFENRIYPDANGVTIYFTDISDRKAAAASHQQAEQLRHELSLLELTLDSILAGYWDIDCVANTAYMSPGLKAMFGYADHELATTADTWKTLIFPEDLPLALESLTHHIQNHGQVPFYNEVRYRHKDGSTVWVICAGQVIAWDTTGQPRRMVGCHVDITHLKHAETKLQKNEAHLRTAQRIGNLGSWELDLNTQALTWSDQVYRIFGRGLDSGPPTMESFNQQLHPDDAEIHQQRVERAITDGEIYDCEFRILRPDGTLVYLQSKGERVLNADGQPTHLTGTVQDISERKRSEAERQQHEAEMQNLSLRLSLALKSACIGSWERILNTDEVIWDQCLVDLYGFARLGRQATYQDWRAQVYADDIDWVEAANQALLESNIPYDTEFRVWRGDGSLGWIRSSALVQRDAHGQPLSVIGINYDITEKKQTADELKALSARLTLALESGGFGSWEWDVATNVINWDERLIELYGFEEGRPTTYQKWCNRVHREDRQTVEAALQATLETDAPYDSEFRIWRSDGELRWIKANALVYRTPEGQPISMIGINYDITEAKLAELHMWRTAAQLEASNRELEAFSYSVSHDLRAPLRAIDGFSRALLEDYGDQFDEEGQDYFDRIRHNVSRMGQLIDDLLRLSRVSRQAMVYGMVNLSDLVEEQLDELQATDPDRALTATITPEIVVSADTTLMRVAIANLVQNAWKFTSHRPSARLEFGVMMQAGEPVYYLRDNGAGFDMAYADKLFGVFQRLHNTDEFPGTGIGLATVQRAIHRQGG